MKSMLRSILLLFTAIACLFSITSCNKSKPEESVTDHLEWAYRKEKVDDYNGYITYTEYDGIKYAFRSDSFDENHAIALIEELAGFIQETDSLFLEEGHGSFPIYFGIDSETRTSITSTLCLPADCSLSFNAVWEIMKRAHKDDLICAEQYGLLYLYCRDNEICEDNSSTEKINDNTSLRKFFDDPNNLYFLDFNIPMLDDVYFTEDQAVITREAAKAFATWYADTYSFDDYVNLCQTIESYDKADLVQLKNDWLESIGCSQIYTELGKLPLRYSEYYETVDEYRTHPTQTKSCIVTYEIETTDAIWMWDDRDVASCSYVDMVKNYNHIEPLRLQCFAEARDLLKDYLPDDLGKVYIHTYFENGKDDYRGGFFDRKNSLFFPMAWTEVKYSILHEYVHFLTIGPGKIMPKSKQGQLAEWPAVWVSCYQVDNPLNLEAYCEVNDIENESYDRQTARLGTFQYIMKKYQSKETMDTDRAVETTEDIPWPVSINSLFYPEYGALAEYVYETYGMDTLIQLLQSDDDFEGILGISFDRLYFDMIRWVEQQVDVMETMTTR